MSYATGGLQADDKVSRTSSFFAEKSIPERNSKKSEINIYITYKILRNLYGQYWRANLLFGGQGAVRARGRLGDSTRYFRATFVSFMLNNYYFIILTIIYIY